MNIQTKDMCYVFTKAKPLMPNPVVVEPNTSVEENGSLKFTFSGNTGKPASKFKWTKYIGSTKYTISTTTTTTVTQEPNGCTFKGVSTITLRMTRTDNQAMIRCTVDSHDTLPISETDKLYQQTDKITVYCEYVHFNCIIYYHYGYPVYHT